MPAAGAVRTLLFASAWAVPALAQLTCSLEAPAPEPVRAEGIAERLADLRVICGGGTPTAAGAPIPVYDFAVTVVGVRVTSKVLDAAQQTTEALALLDEPSPANQFVCADSNGNCPAYGNGSGAGYYGAGAQTPSSPNNRNVFQGVLSGANTLRFRVPVDPPGPSGQRAIRFTNIRVNASELGLATGMSAAISAGVSAVSGPAALPLTGSLLVPAGTAGLALSAGVRNAQNTAPMGPFTVGTSAAASELRIATLRFAETQNHAFRARSTGNPAQLPANQNSPGVFNRNLENGFFNGGFPNVPGRGNLGQAGLASHGTRLVARFANVPPEARLFVQSSADLLGGVGGETPVGFVRLIETDVNGNGIYNPSGFLSLIEIPLRNGERVAVWEVTNSEGDSPKYADLGVYASFAAGVNWTVPTAVNMTLGPVSGGFLPSDTEAIPRFAPRGSGACIYTLSSTDRAVPLDGASFSVTVTSAPGCAVNVFSSAGWIQATARTNGLGGGVADLRVAFNPGTFRAGEVLIGDARFTVTQAGGFGSAAAPTVVNPPQNQVIGVRGVSFSWNPVNGAFGYEMRAFDANSGALVFSGSLAGAPSTNMLGDFPPGLYDFHVRACIGGFGDNFCGPFSSTRFQVFLAAPAANPAITAPTPNQVLTGSTTEFRWTAVSDAASYLVQVFDALSNPVYQISAPGGTTSTVYSMRGGAFRLRVLACGAACNNTDNSVVFTASLPAVPSGAPSISTASVTGSTLTATWTPVPGADIYRLQVVQPNAGPGGGALTVGSARTATNTASLPIPSGSASVFVAACNGNGCGPYSAPSAINATGSNPAAPVLGVPIPGTEVDGPGITFSWSRIPGDNGSNTTYRLFVSDLSTGRTAFDVHTTGNFAPGFFLSGGRRYDALVVANPGPGQIVGPAAGFVILGGESNIAPALVAPAHRSQVRQGNVQLGWAEGAGATLYQYFVAVTGQAQPTATGVSAGFLVQVPLTAIGGAPTSYTGIVRACRAAACSPNSDAGWTPWSNAPGGPGVTTFTVTP